jgi:hypothetical protein
MTKKKTVKAKGTKEGKRAAPASPDPEPVVTEEPTEPAPALDEHPVEVLSSRSTALTRPVQRSIASPVGPWSRLTRAWLRESEKLHEISVDRMGSVIDDSHRLALEGVATITSISLTYQRGMLDQLERSMALLTGFGRSAA